MTASQGTIIVTGAGGGLGSAIAAHLAMTHPEFHVILTIRDASAPSAALQAAVQDKLPSYEFASLDLSRLASVREFATTTKGRVARGSVAPIRALILNAGLLELEEQTFAPQTDGERSEKGVEINDSFDMSFAVNYLGHWLLTLMLLGSMDRVSGRVVALGTFLHDPLKPGRHQSFFPGGRWTTFVPQDGDINPIALGSWSSIKDDPSQKSGFRRYAAAKFCLLSMMVELQRRLARDPVLRGITTIGVDPGTMPTGIIRRETWMIRSGWHKSIVGSLAWVASFVAPNGMLRRTEKSAADVVDAALGDRWRGRGAIYLDGSVESDPSVEVNDPAKGAIVWRDTARYTRLTVDDTELEAWN
ncbi:WW domain-containing oxidoreductase [Microdochium nivale]|nr:WW domain-containing oxidoreductase [Microdochium nivale]